MSLSLYAQLGLTDNFTKPMRRVTEQMKMAAKASKMMSGQYSKLTESAKTYTGTTASFIDKIGDLGKQEKKLADGFVASNDKMQASFYKGIGSILARSTASEKVAQNFERMGNPIYKLSNPLLKVSQGIENITKKSQPAYLALKMLGPTANMKQLQDMTGLITKGMMRFQSVALASAIASAVLYSSLHKAAMKNKEYAESFNGMKEKLREAFQPMVDVFTAVMPKVYDFISAIADMAIKFNEAHPMLSKIIQGFLMLLPAVTLLLSPLAVGIGMFGGLAASWAVLAPLIAGIAAISGPVLLVTAGIVALTAAGVLLYKNWDTVKLKTTELWSKLGAFKGIATLILGPLGLIIRAAVTMASNWDSTKSVWENVWNGIKLAASSAVNDVIGSINAMIAHINKIPGVNVPIIAKVSWGQTRPPAEYSRSVGQGRQTSHAGGLSRVPYDGYSASLHRGERVLTARENKEYSSGKGASSISIGDIHLHGVAGDMEKAADQLLGIITNKIQRAGLNGA
ncbi:hypothetical protein P4597_18920 [Peribacillus simplex]|uniref:hypothetical protein n=1 Tax=Peribacillus simplex TaxID=1478 RepID=UPI002E1B76CE|nr:hypothetical protein [Peribacillus simplex]